MVGDFKLFYSVESVNLNLFFALLFGCHVPTLFEDLDALHLQQLFGRLFVPIVLIRHFDDLLIAHGINDLSEVDLSRRYLLENNVVFDVVTLVDFVVDGECVDEPLTYAAFVDVVGTRDVVIFVFSIAFDFNAKELRYRNFVSVKGSYWQFFLVVVCPCRQPSTLNIFKRAFF